MYNIGKVKIWGDEIHADVSWNNTVGLIARYSFQWAREDGSDFQIPYIPLHSASFNFFGAIDAFRLDIKGFVTGSRLTAENLERTERAEDGLRSLGLREFRVRTTGTGARVEIAPEERKKAESLREDITRVLLKYYTDVIFAERRR